MISIAMTTYNGEKYLNDQMISILNQSISDFELIICDDNSSDGTFSILQDFASKDNRIKLFRNENNLGFKRNFEKAVLLCCQEYIALCDQDDVWESNHLKILLDELKEKSCSVGNAIIMDGEGKSNGTLLSEGDNYYVDGSDNDKLFRILFYGNPFQGTSSLYRKDLLVKALPIPNEIEYHDAWFAACACCEEGINYTFRPITKYRIHGNNASGSHKISLVKRIKNTITRKGYKTDRKKYCEELIKRFPNMKDNVNQIITLANAFYIARSRGKKLFVVKILIKYYKKIYATNSYRLLISRCIGVLIKG